MWRIIIGWPGYEISSLGNVRSYRSINGRGPLKTTPRLLKSCKSTYGYLQSHLYRDGRMFTRLTHTLVCEAFYGKRKQGMQCRHLNGDKTDNRLNNLRYGTSKENEADKIAHGRTNRGTRQHCSKLTEADVLAIRADTRVQHKIAKDYNITQRNVSAIKTRKNWAWL